MPSQTKNASRYSSAGKRRRDFLAAIGPPPLGLVRASTTLGSPTAMTAFTYELDQNHTVSPEVKQAISNAVEPILRSQGMEGVQVIPGLDHDGDPVLYVELKFRLVQPGVDPKILIKSGPAVRRALWALGERRFPHLRYDFNDYQRVLGTENW